MKYNKIFYKNNLQKFRVLKSITQGSLAYELGISTREVSLIENHKVAPNESTIQRILDYFNVSFDQMFYERMADVNGEGRKLLSDFIKYSELYPAEMSGLMNYYEDDFLRRLRLLKKQIEEGDNEIR